MEFVRNRGQSGPAFARNVARAMFHNPLVLGILAGFEAGREGTDPAVHGESAHQETGFRRCALGVVEHEGIPFRALDNCTES